MQKMLLQFQPIYLFLPPMHLLEPRDLRWQIFQVLIDLLVKPLYFYVSYVLTVPLFLSLTLLVCDVRLLSIYLFVTPILHFLVTIVLPILTVFVLLPLALLLHVRLPFYSLLQSTSNEQCIF